MVSDMAASVAWIFATYSEPQHLTTWQNMSMLLLPAHAFNKSGYVAALATIGEP